MKGVRFSAHQFHKFADNRKFVLNTSSASEAVVEEMAPIWKTASGRGAVSRKRSIPFGAMMS